MIICSLNNSDLGYCDDYFVPVVQAETKSCDCKNQEDGCQCIKEEEIKN